MSEQEIAEFTTFSEAFIAGKPFTYSGGFSLLRDRELVYNPTTGKITASRTYPRTVEGVVTDELSVDEYWFERFIHDWFDQNWIEVSRHRYGKIKMAQNELHLKEAA